MPDPTNARLAFRPRITLMLAYVVFFFFLFCAALVAPSLIELWQELPEAPNALDLELAKKTAMRVARPRLGLALAAAVITTAAGSSAGLLPGIDGPDDQAS